MRTLRRAYHLGRVRFTEPRNVCRYGAGEKLDGLRQVTDMRAKALARPGGDVGAVEAHDAGGRPPHTDEQPRKRRLPRRARTNHAERLARHDAERNAANDRPVRALQPE